MNLAEMRGAYIDDGYGYEAASTRSCQDAFLVVTALSAFADKVTFKGGIVMQQVSGDRRRGTRDIDFGFMRYSIADGSIRAFVKKLNSNKAGIRIHIDGPIEELKHQDYDGGRVHVTVSDEAGNSMKTKLDIGVHADLSIEQRVGRSAFTRTSYTRSCATTGLGDIVSERVQLGAPYAQSASRARPSSSTARRSTSPSSRSTSALRARIPPSRKSSLRSWRARRRGARQGQGDEGVGVDGGKVSLRVGKGRKAERARSLLACPPRCAMLRASIPVWLQPAGRVRLLVK